MEKEDYRKGWQEMSESESVGLCSEKLESRLDEICGIFEQTMLQKTGIKWFVGYRRDVADFRFRFISQRDQLETGSWTENRIKWDFRDWDHFVEDQSNKMITFSKARNAHMEQNPIQWEPFLVYTETLFKLAESGNRDLYSDETMEAGRIFQQEKTDRQ